MKTRSATIREHIAEQDPESFREAVCRAQTDVALTAFDRRHVGLGYSYDPRKIELRKAGGLARCFDLLSEIDRHCVAFPLRRYRSLLFRDSLGLWRPAHSQSSMQRSEL